MKKGLERTVSGDFQELMRQLTEGVSEADECLEAGWGIVAASDRACETVWRTYADDAMAAARPLFRRIGQVVRTQSYPHCYRSCFGALVYNPDSKEVVAGPCFNAPPGPALSVCKESCDTCIRALTGKSKTNNYNNCPAVHAAGNLFPPKTAGTDLLWLEGGAVRNASGEYQWARKDMAAANPLDRIYRCSMCLTQMLSRDVHYVGCFSMDENGKPVVSFHLVAAHLSMLLLLETAAALK